MIGAGLAFGITAGRRPWLGELSSAVERLGFGELWANDVPGASGLETLAVAADAAPRLHLAVGVMALTEHRPAAIARQVASLGIAAERLTIGVGSGSSRSRAVVREGVAAVRDLLPGVAIAVAAVGPRMAELGGEVADVVLLNWAAPRLAGERRAAVEQAAAAAGRATPRVAAYVRVAVGPGAARRLAAEQAKYARYGGSYRAVIGQQEGAGESALGIAVEPDDERHTASQVAAALAPYRSVLDTVVVRGVPPADTLEGWLAVARAGTLRP